MSFEILNIDEFENFIGNNKLNNFLQSPLMDEMAKLKNQKVYYAGMKKGKKIVCAARLLCINSKFNKKIFYAPRGFITDYNDMNLLKQFTAELKKFIKSKNGFELIIDPNILYKERDIDGKIVPAGFDNSNIINNLKSIGFKHLGFTKGVDMSRQVRWSFALDIKKKTEDEIFKIFKQNTRNLISKAVRTGVKVEELNYEDLYKLKKITQGTASRIGFNDKSLEYYQTMYKAFAPNNKAKFLLASLNLEEYLNSIKVEKEHLEERLYKINSENKKKNLVEEINNLDKRIVKTKEIIKNDGNIIDLSAAMFITYGKEVIYGFSGNVDKYMPFNGAYLIQWEMIKYAIKNNFEKYNFYGISGIFDKSDPNYGVYEFKKGFGGVVEEYIGEFSLPISSYYYINKLIKLIKR